MSRRPSDLASVAEPWVPTAATWQEMLLRNACMDIGLAVMVTWAAAIGTYRGGDIPLGSTYRIWERAAVLTACSPRSARSGAEYFARNRLPLGLDRELLAQDAAIPCLHLMLLVAQARRPVQFEGGLTRACSRLGRRASSTVPLGLRRSQFEGTSRCLGRMPSPPTRLGRDSTPAWQRGTR